MVERFQRGLERALTTLPEHRPAPKRKERPASKGQKKPAPSSRDK